MIQVDVFWSFAMGACFAACATQGIKKCNSPFVNRYFVYCVCFLSMVFAPSGIYLLWHHTGWETMYFLDKDLHGIWPCLFAHTNVSLGVLGFYICYQMIKHGYELQTHAVWISGYCGMFAILSFGYDRFLYAGSLSEWRQGVKYPLTDIVYSAVFWDLLAMSIFVIPPLYYAMAIWPSEYGITAAGKREIIRAAFSPYVVITALAVLAFFVAFSFGFLPPTWALDRVIAYLIAQTVFGIVLAIPLLMIPVRKTAQGNIKNGRHVERIKRTN